MVMILCCPPTWTDLNHLTIYFKRSHVADRWSTDMPSPHEHGQGLLLSATGQRQAVGRGSKKSRME